MYDQDYEYDQYYDDADDQYYDDAAMDTDAGVMAGGVTSNVASGASAAEARTITMPDALEMQASVVAEVARLTCLSRDAATLLLNNYFWAKDVAVERYFEDPDTVLKSLSLTHEIASAEHTLLPGVANSVTTCGICACDYEAEEVCCLSTCRHYFCKECWQDHIKTRVHENLLATRCPAQNCKEVVGLGVMAQLFSDADSAAVLRDIYREYLGTYVQSCPSLYWCPNKSGCSGIIHVEVPPLQGQGVTCDVCRGASCLRCADEPHRPATCDHMRDWRRYCSSEGANIAFILVKTKQCPKCHKDIEKNGGCNHMTCKCGYEFCWVCQQSWKSHGGDFYSCKNAGSSDASNDKADVRDSKRFMYHYVRYTTHLDSARRDTTFIDNYTNNAFVVDTAEKALRKSARDEAANGFPVESAIAAPDVIALIKNTLVTARPVIAHAYVELFYLDDKTNEAMLLAHRVGKLEEATEQLSGRIVEYLRLAKSQLGSMVDLVSTVDRWKKVVCES